MESNHNDPVIDEIREVRHRISETFDHDPAKLVAYYMQLQEQYRDRLIGLAKTEANTAGLAAETGLPADPISTKRTGD